MMPASRVRPAIGALLAITMLSLPVVASAQLPLQGVVHITGLTHPLGFIQDPSNPAIQYIPQQEGVIRVVRNGVLETTPFLDLSGSISMGGERGLLGLAFPPDYASSGRFYVDFTDPAGASVVARFRRDAANPLVADPASRFDLKWSNGLRSIPQPFANHNGGHLVFGPDGMLYIGKGDGGGANDPNHNAQNPASLLGKMLRIDVNVADSDDEGLDIPSDNPFRTSNVPEIWAFGLRNPWQFTFDNRALGGTGAMLIGDVGQNAREEIDYEPAGRGGRNYGWRNREGTRDNVVTLPPAFTPLIDPIYEYDHAAGVGRSVTGGYVYRGLELGGITRGRYFFGDFISGRVWSLAVRIDPATGEATASDLRDHTAELFGSADLSISAFGEDAGGELYVVDHGGGSIWRITPVVTPGIAAMRLDLPQHDARLRVPFIVSGFAFNAGSVTGTGIETPQVWMGTGDPLVPPVSFGDAVYGLARPDVAAIYGSQFANSGFARIVPEAPPGRYFLVAFGRVIANPGSFAIDFVEVTVEGGGLVVIESPAANSTVTRPFVVRGVALDGAATSGTGVSGLLAYAIPVGGGTPISLGVPTYGIPRPDIAAIVGARFQNSGFSVTVSTLPAGTYDLALISRSTVTGTYSAAHVIRVTVQ